MSRTRHRVKGDFMRLKGYTLAEVLITLVIIGIVAAITLSTLITNILNNAYTERLKKAYSLLQQTTNFVAEDIGSEPQNWDFYTFSDNEDYSKNILILDAYAKQFRFTKKYGFASRGYNDYLYNVIRKNKISYKYLNGEPNADTPYGNEIFCLSNVIELADGTTIGIRFSHNPGGGNSWTLINAKIPILYTVDVNGLAKPNKIGRDVFFFFLKDGKVVPSGIGDTSDCTKSGTGYSCAAKVIYEGKMNY